ncbi:MAG: hypothetical protein OES32_15195 [Acidobacteriota bacterium]|nr:hypothetical protein [Acidobacteriota bacterium]MDH3524927.1 hypothetical protein [Acidobacteriota bacterium]
MDETLAIKDQLMATFQNMLSELVGAIPKVILGLALIVLAILAAKIVQLVLKVILTRIRFDSLLSKVGVDQALERIGMRQVMSEVLPKIAYFLLLFLFAKAAAEGMGLTAISEAIGSFLSYVPNLVAAVVIVLLGSTAGQLAGGAIGSAAESSGIEFGATLGKLVSALILFVAGIMALGQLQVDTDIVRVVTTCFLAGLALAFALSFGLGTREISRNIIAGFYARKVFEIGEEMEVGEERGVLRAITPTQILLEQDGRTVAISNSVFVERVVKQ